MNLLVKVGGTLLDRTESRRSLAAQLHALAQSHRLVIVHGGGKQLTVFLEGKGLRSRFVNGLRVSDPAVIEALCQVVAGSVNKQFVSAFAVARPFALGLSGVDGALTRAEQLHPDLGFVGQPVASNGPLLDLLVDAGYLPVVACLAAGANGAIYNVNADAMAVSCAVAFRAEKLFFLTDVPGVKDGAGPVLGSLVPEEISELIRSGAAHGGMQAKLQAAVGALAGGVIQVVIAPGQEPDVCLRILSGEPIGTGIVLSAANTVGAQP